MFLAYGTRYCKEKSLINLAQARQPNRTRLLSHPCLTSHSTTDLVLASSAFFRSSSLTRASESPHTMAEEFGRFELLKRLGGSAMGDTYLARQKGLTGFEKFLVIKALSPSLSENDEFVAMFLDEARLAARLQHPNVCQVYDLGLEDGVPFMAVEYVHGVSLAQLHAELVKLDTVLPAALAVRIAAETAAGLHYAHELTDERGRSLEIVHRDVSPSNVLVTFEGCVKLRDFGLARATNGLNRTHGQSVKGKLAHMAPEQLGNGSVDRRADVFSLGIVLHELLTGKRLFLRPGDVETLAAVISAPIPPPSKFNDEVPPALDEVVLKALARDPTERFHSAQALQLALESWLRDTRDPSTGVHLAKFVRQLYVERLDIERRKGLLWDAPTGPIAPWVRPKQPPPRARTQGSRPSIDITAIERTAPEEETQVRAVAADVGPPSDRESGRATRYRMVTAVAAGLLAVVLLAGLVAAFIS